VWQRHKAQLWRYRSDAVRYRPPVLVVHSLISRSYVLDLYAGNSAVAFFLGAGLDVFLIDWGEADEADADNTLETYADEYLPAAIAATREVSGSDEVTLLGYCFGGVLALLTCALHPDLPVRSLAMIATPVDFDGMGAITGPVRDGRLDPEDIIDETGNVPPDAIENAFRMLKPTAEITQYATLWETL
jgi:polyhydroxyalkanoate synthase